MKKLNQLSKEKLHRTASPSPQRTPPVEPPLRVSLDLERELMARLETGRGMPFQRAPHRRVQDIELD